MNDQKKTCPSSTCNSGAKLIGVVNSNGRVDLLKRPLEIDEAFVEEAHKGRQPELRFRFAGQCVQSGCKQWTSSGCGIIQAIAQVIPKQEVSKNLPTCGIRKTCRWYFQQGDQACVACTWIVTDNRIEIT